MNAPSRNEMNPTNRVTARIALRRKLGLDIWLVELLVDGQVAHSTQRWSEAGARAWAHQAIRRALATPALGQVGAP